jgi:hypothetical protein
MPKGKCFMGLSEAKSFISHKEHNCITAQEHNLSVSILDNCNLSEHRRQLIFNYLHFSHADMRVGGRQLTRPQHSIWKVLLTGIEC